MKATPLRATLAAALLAASLVAAAPVASAAPTTTGVAAHCPTASGAVKVEAEDSPMTVSVLDTRTGLMLDAVVTITGTTFVVTPVDPTVTLTDASWCVKSSTKVNSGVGTSGASTSTNKKGVVQAISYVLLYSVTTKSPVVVVPCNALTTSGGEGVTINAVELGTAGPNTFTIDYETYSVPDDIQVYYEGKLIADTGYVGDQINEGTGSITVAIPAGTSSQVEIKVTGPSGTAWDYTANCPVA